ncbi:MAG: alpha/beta hydrolase [Myxococcales bacterium]|nr:alpha/beta hydrolase [Myxococcales bacterium]
MLKWKSIRWVILGVMILAIGGFIAYKFNHRDDIFYQISEKPTAKRRTFKGRHPFKRYDNIAYLPEAAPPDKRQLLDLIVPVDGENKPSVIVLHGGGWTSGDRKVDCVQEVAEWLAVRGIIGVPLDFRLVPEVSLVDQIRDVAAGVAWLSQHIAEYGGDPQRIYLLGHSAGAHISALLASDRQYLDELGVPPEVPAGVIALAGLYDVRDISKATSLIGRPATRILYGADEDFLRRMSPLVYVHAGMPSFLFLNGKSDDLIKESQTADMARAIIAAGGSATVALIPHRNHQTIFSSIPDPGDAAGEAIRQFIK